MSDFKNNAQIRKNNIRTVLETIKEEGPISKRSIQCLTGLSWGSVSTIANVLYDVGYITLVGTQKTNIGRKPFELDINSENNYIVGVALNLSGFYAVITDIKGRVVQKWTQYFIHKNKSTILNTLLLLLDNIILSEYSGKKILGIGVALQGRVKEKGVSIDFSGIEDWKNIPFKMILEQRYKINTVLLQDTYCIIETEKDLGISFLKSAANVVFLRIDSNISISFMINGEISFETNGFGHISVNKNGALCTCGKRGCLQEYVTCNGLIHRFIEQINNGQSTIVDMENINSVNGKLLAEAASHGDILCGQLFNQMGEYLGLALSMINNLLNPDFIVIYSELSLYKKLFLDALYYKLNAHTFYSISSKLLFSKLKSDAAALGASLLVSKKAVEELELLL